MYKRMNRIITQNYKGKIQVRQVAEMCFEDVLSFLKTFLGKLLS